MNRTRRRVLLHLPLIVLLASGGCASDSSTDAGSSTTEGTTSSTTEGAAATTVCRAPTYTVEYPADWTTNTAAQGEACEWFHPEPFEIPENSEAVGIAIHLRYDEVDYAFVSDPSNNSEEVLELDRTEIEGLPATRMRTRSKGEGLLDEGVESITWYIDAASVTFAGATHGVALPGIDTNGPVLDDMIRSLRFIPVDGGPRGVDSEQ